MKLFVYIIIILFANVSLAQKDSVEVFSNPQTSPEFPGGLVAQTKFIKDNFMYPTSAKEKGISGKCYVSFVIDTIGQIKNIKVLKGIKDCSECDEEAIRLTSVMPNWIPASLNGKTVECRINYQVNFIMK